MPSASSSTGLRPVVPSPTGYALTACLPRRPGGLLNAFPCSAFAQNVGLVGLTGIRSRFVVAVSGLILVVLGLFPKLGAVIASLPLPVLGGAGLALFGTVAASGIRSLSAVDYEGNANLVIVALAIGVGVIPIAVPDFYEEFPSWFETIFESGISAAAVTAVLLNLLFNARRRRPSEGPIYSEGPAPGLTPDYQPGGHVPHEDAFTHTHPHLDVDQGARPPHAVPHGEAPPRTAPPDEEAPRQAP